MIDIGQLLADSEIFQGGIVLMVLGAALAYLRNAPRLIGRAFTRWCTSSVQFREVDIVRWVGQWLAAGEYAQRCLRLNGRLDHQGEKPKVSLEPGLGTHLFRYNGHWILLKHQLEDDGEPVGGFFLKNRTMKLWVLGRKSTHIRRIVDEAIDMALARRYGKQIAYINHSDFWTEIKIDDKRPVESIILSEKDEMLADTEWFLGAGDWHLLRGLPYRRGYLFHGPPGNGKSTMIQVLAGHFELPIYVLSLTGKNVGDTALYALMAQVPHRAIVAIEDVDKVRFDNEDGEGVTLSGLLNVVDGVLAGAGRILILTANDTKGLPTPLLRRGRVDREWLFDTPGRKEIEAMFQMFYPEADVQTSIFGASVAEANLSMAAIQQHLVRYPTPKEAVESVNDLLDNQTEGSIR